MADPLGVIASILAITTAAIQSVQSLNDVVTRYKGCDRRLHRLQSELHDVSGVLDSLKEVILAEVSIPALLKEPVGRCSEVCQEFKLTMLSFDEKSKTDIRDWAKLEFMRGDINDFIDTISGYKSTITVGLGIIALYVQHFAHVKPANSPPRRKAKVPQDALEVFNEMVLDTVHDLNVLLQRVDDKLTDLSTSRSPAPGVDLTDEKEVTKQCFRICENAKEYLDLIMKSSVLEMPNATNDKLHDTFKVQLPALQREDFACDPIPSSLSQKERIKVQNTSQYPTTQNITSDEKDTTEALDETFFANEGPDLGNQGDQRIPDASEHFDILDGELARTCGYPVKDTSISVRLAGPGADSREFWEPNFNEIDATASTVRGQDSAVGSRSETLANAKTVLVHRDAMASVDDIIDDDPMDTTSFSSHMTTAIEKDARSHVAYFMANDPDLGVLCSKVVNRLGQAHFSQHGRKLLKVFYEGLLEDAQTGLEKQTANLLKSRRGRYRISTEVAHIITSAAMHTAEYKRLREQRLERFLKDAKNHEQWGETTFPEAEKIFDGEDLFKMSGSESEEKMEIASNVEAMITFLRNSPSFESLVSGLTALLLPQYLRDIVASYSVEVEDHDPKLFSNHLKALVEDYTMLDWNWWPLERRMKPLKLDQSRLIWHCSCGARLWMEISKDEATLVRSISDLPKSNPSLLPQCHRKSHLSSTWWRQLAKNIAYSLSQLRASGPSRAHPALPTVATSAATSQAVTIGQMTPSTETSSAPANVPSKPPPSPTQSPRLSPTTTPQTNFPTAGSAVSPRWVLYGVQGSRRTIELEHIEIDEYTNDSSFYRSLREHYRKHRSIWKRLFSIWRLEFCDGVRFDRLAPNFILGNEVDLPTDFNEYQYDPVPPDARNPLIEKHYAEIFLNCDDPCRWRLFHECVPDLVCRTMIKRVPRKRTRFDLVNINSNESQAWGLKPRHSPSAVYVAFYHMLILILPFAFWGWWQATHPDDLQNASVPVTVVLGMLSLFWGTNGLLSQGRHIGERTA